MSSVPEIEKIVKQSDLLLLGMSSSPEFAESEILAGTIAQDSGIPYGFYSDMSLCPYRAREGAWFQNLAKNASFLFGLLPTDIRTITSIFPSARCVNTGNPLRDAMAFPTLSRHEVREKLGIKLDEKFILAPGGKFAAGNSLIWMLIINALHGSELKEDAVVVFSPHPGDTVLRTVDSASGKKLNIYEEIVTDSPIRAQYVTKDVLPTLDMVAGADVVIEFTGSASVCAAYQRIPLIHVTPEVWLNRFRKESGEAMIETLGVGAGILVKNISECELMFSIRELIDSSSTTARQLKIAQERAYPVPTSHTASLAALVSAIGAQIGL